MLKKLDVQSISKPHLKATRFKLRPSPFKCPICEPSNQKHNKKLMTTIAVLIFLTCQKFQNFKIY